MNTNPLILFDGVCNFCNFWVRFVIKRDKKKRIKFSTLQSEIAKKLATEHQIDLSKMDSVIFIENGVAYTQSTAALRICKYLDGGWILLTGLLIIPAFIRNMLYNWVAKNRYKWFGKKEECMIPTFEDRKRFLD